MKLTIFEKSSMREKARAVLLSLCLAPGLHAAIYLHLLPPGPGLIASSDVRSNALVEGITRGSMTNHYWNFGPSYGWRRTVTEIASNGLFRVDYSVFRGEHSRPPSRPDLSVLLFRPPGRFGAPPNQLDWEQRFAEQLDVQRAKIHGVKSPTLRVPNVLWVLEEALDATQFFTANATRYQFLGTNDGFSFVAALPPSFPGVPETGGVQARRVRVFLESRRGREPSLLLEHVPLLLDGYVEPFRILLARDVLWFATSFFDRAAQQWTNSWGATNALPGRVGITLALSGSGQFASRGIELPGTAVPPESQGGLGGLIAGPLEVATNLPSARNREKLWPGPTQPHAVELEWLGRSGVELARYFLAHSGPGVTQYDALNQKWAGGTGDSNSPIAHIPMQDFPLGGGTISLRMVDLDRRFNINFGLIAPEILNMALLIAGVEPSEALSIVEAIQDWRDADDTPRSNGAESGYYLTLNPPHTAKNGTFDDVAELLMVKGVTPRMFFGSTNAGESTVGLKDLFTTVSARFININTASAEVMQLIPDVDGSLAQAIVATRAGPDGLDGTEDDMPFRSIGELANVPGMTPQLAQMFARYFSTRSSTFEVTADVKLGRQTRQFSAWLQRNGPVIQTLKFERTK